jgi:hypothetical protein
MKLYFHNAITGEILGYEIDSNGNCPGGVLKGHLRAYGDAITTGFKIKQEAEQWAKEWGYCPKCRTTIPIKNKLCSHCKGILTQNIIKGAK